MADLIHHRWMRSTIKEVRKLCQKLRLPKDLNKEELIMDKFDSLNDVFRKIDEHFTRKPNKPEDNAGVPDDFPDCLKKRKKPQLEVDVEDWIEWMENFDDNHKGLPWKED